MTEQPKHRTALEERLTGLAAVTAELVGAEDLEAVARAVTQHSADAAGATMASLTLRDGVDHLRLVALRGGSEADLSRYQRIPLTTRTPSTDVVGSGHRMVLGPQEVAAAYPDLPGWDQGERTILALPLRVPSGTLGAIALAFPGRRAFDDTELDFFEILADSCAQACARIEAQAVADTSLAKLGFLATASAELGSSLDYTMTLANVARLAVPRFADWCGIDVLRDGRLDRLAVAHVDPEKVRLAQELHERYPTSPDVPSGPWQVIRTGKGELIAEITDEMLVAGARDEEHLRIARELQLHSAVTAPLTARGRTLGVITWVTAESGRSYTQEDAAFLGDLAERAAVAIDNAELHSETAAMATRLQRAVLPAELPTVPGLQLAAYYSPSGRTDVGGDFYDVIPLPEGRVALVVGDVMGRGVAAAAAMAQVRAAARAYIAVDPAPSVVMTNLDRLHAVLAEDQLVTIVYLLVDLATGRAVVGNAGHPPPLLVSAEGRGRQVVGSGVAVGANAYPREEVSVSVAPGETLVLFTDGLVERRDEDIDVGQARLLEAAEVLLTGGDLTAGLDALVTTVRDASRDDDVAALVVRRSNGPVPLDSSHGQEAAPPPGGSVPLRPAGSMTPLNDSSLVAEFAYDVASQTWTWTPGLRELHGLDEATAPTTEHLLAPMHPEDRPVMAERFQRHLEQVGTYTCMYRMTDAAGRRHQLRFVGKAVAEEGTVVTLQGFVLDISGDVQAWTTQAVDGVMEHHAAIEQAKGALMLAFHVGADEAFDMLRTFSNRQNRKLALVAEEISAGLSDPSLADQDPVTVLMGIMESPAVGQPPHG